jgi:hypothetical protein
VKVYRQGLYEAVRQYLKPMPNEELASDEEPLSVLLSQGELDFYLGQYQANLSESLRLLGQTSEIIGCYITETSARTARLERLLSAPRFDLRLHSEVDHLGGVQLAAFANDLVAISGPLTVVTSQMLNALTRSLAVASDTEFAERTSFEQKLSELRDLQALLQSTISNASACREQMATYPRGSTVFNRGKRLALAAIDDHVHQLSRMAEVMKAAESDLQGVLALL